MKKYFYTFCYILVLVNCSDDSTDSICKLIPDQGNCDALFRKYFYDQKDKKCKEFIWGGCGGTVPFETIQDCQKMCDCK
jgi:Kunitz/Bovine pancreatic trypsin inhibitor domain